MPDGPVFDGACASSHVVSSSVAFFAESRLVLRLEGAVFAKSPSSWLCCLRFFVPQTQVSRPFPVRLPLAWASRPGIAFSPASTFAASAAERGCL